MESINPDAQRVLIQILATWVLFAVFTLSALAFVLVIFGVLKPDRATKTFLFGLFSVSAVGLLISAASDFLRVDPKKATEAISRDSEREASASRTRVDPNATLGAGRITVYTQLGRSEDSAQFESIKNTLATSRFSVTQPEVMNQAIAKSEVRYCNSLNASDANELKAKLESKGFSTLDVTQIPKCDPEKNKNVLELWVQSSRP